MNVKKVDGRVLGPVLAGFFIMGFCDIVAPITGRIATEFPEELQGAVSFLPTMVFLWFLILSTPVAALMNRIGRRATALWGYLFTFAGLLLPYAAGPGYGLDGTSPDSDCSASATRSCRWPSTRCWRRSSPGSG